MQIESTTVEAELEAMKQASGARLKEAASEVESVRTRSCELELHVQ